MKKYLIKWYLVAICFILAMLSCCLSGCSTGATVEEPTQNINMKFYYRDAATLLYTAEIEGHLYVIYSGTYKGGIIHAEHCPCKMK